MIIKATLYDAVHHWSRLIIDTADADDADDTADEQMNRLTDEQMLLLMPMLLIPMLILMLILLLMLILMLMLKML